MVKKLLCSILAVVILSSFSGCADGDQLHERMLIKSIGVDFKEDEYKVSVRSVNMEEEGEEVHSATGKCVYDALNALSISTGNTQMYSHTYFVIFGKEAAKRMDDSMDFFVRYFKSSPTLAFFVAEGKAEEILNTKTDDKLVSSEHIENLRKSEKNSGKTLDTDLLTFISHSLGASKTALIPCLKTDGEEISFVGTKFFFDCFDRGMLSLEETMGYLAVKDRIQQSVIVVKDEKLGKVTAEISKVKPKIKLGDSPDQVRIDVNSQCSLVSITMGTPVSREDFERVEKLVEAKIIENISSCITTAYSENCDVFLIGDKLYREKTEYWKGIEKDWESMISKLKFDVNVEVNIDRPGEENRPPY